MIPKYRMWDKETKSMNGMAEIYRNRNQEIELHPRDKNIILMQSTGLVDKNGKEIFEGDVVRQVRTQPTTENEVIIGVVTMLEGAWLIMNDCEKLASDLWSETDENEIIGNIYENKDILEDKE